MDIPLLDLEAQNRPLREDILAAIARVCDSQRFILGPEVAALEDELSQLLHVRHAIAVSSGTDALLLALMTLGIQPGDEVITTTYSFFATAGAIVRLGARPVFVDIDLQTYNSDPEQVRAAVTGRTKAILPVHLFGLTAELDPIVEVAGARALAVVEDAAQAILAEYKGRRAGSIGTLGCFSFYPTKNLGAFGDAGLLTTGDDELADRARTLRTHGAEHKYYHAAVGGNFRMDAVQAAVLRVKVAHLDRWTEARRANAKRYAALFREADLLDLVALPVEPSGCRHVFNQFVIRTAKRDDLRRYLTERGIGTEIYYPLPFHLQPCFSVLGYRRGDFPSAERAADESLALPIYAELTAAQQEAIVSTIAEFVRQSETSRAPAGCRESRRGPTRENP